MEELARRHENVRAAARRAGLDAVVVAGSEYTGFEGAVTYLSGFTIVHRYAYVVVPVDGEPAIVFPAEARYVGEHAQNRIDEQVFAPHPGEWLADRLRGRRVGVYGLDYVMTVRDYRALAAGAADVVPFDEEFDLARAVKSDAELESVRDSVRINTEGFRIFLEHYGPGRSAAEVMAPCEDYFVREGCGRLTMDMVLTGPEFAVARRDLPLGEFCLPSLEIAGPGGALGRGLARDRQARRGRPAHARGVRGVLRGGARARCARAPARTTCTARCRRGSTTGATTSATSPATRSA